MGYGLKKGMAAALCAGMVLSLLSGCGKKEEKKAVDADADAVTLNDTSMKEDVANFLVRFDQAKFESSMGQFYSYYASSYYGTTNYWDLDFSGQGQTVADSFKTSEQTVLEQLMLCSEHASDYDIVLTDDEKQKISDAAASFIASNTQDTLDAMNATQEVVEEALTYLTIQSKVEQEMTKDVDTNVTDEEAAQRDVDYVSFYASAEAETEAVSEGMTERTTENASEGSSEGLGVSEDTKTGSAAETEAEITAEGTESAAENAAESGTEAVTGTESESETELDEATIEARAKAQAKAEDFLKQVQDADVKDADAFDKLADAAAKDNNNVTHSTFTFGKDDSYPAKAVIDATNDLKDNTLVQQVIQDGSNFYVLYVSDAFDEDATEQKKQEIVNQRKQDAIDAQYKKWEADETWEVNNDFFAALDFNVSLTQQTEAVTEAISEAASETPSEGTSEGSGEGEAVSVS